MKGRTFVFALLAALLLWIAASPALGEQGIENLFSTDDSSPALPTEAPSPTESPGQAESGYAIAVVNGEELTFRQKGPATLTPSGNSIVGTFAAYDRRNEIVGELRISIWVKALEGDRFSTKTDLDNGWYGNGLSYSVRLETYSAFPNAMYNPSMDWDDVPMGSPANAEYAIDITHVSADGKVYEGAFSGTLYNGDSKSLMIEVKSIKIENGQFRMLVDPEL